MQLKNATLQIAFAYALSYYFIQDVNYPVPLKFVMVFLESVMGMVYPLQIMLFLSNA
jgi:hypothetical protein